MQASSSAAAAVKTPTTTSSTSSTASQRQSIAKTATAVITEADSNCEIAEISKKISEHADAIYRTWKCRGLAPTELLDFYTSAAAAESTAAVAPDFLGTGKVAVTDEVTSTEGLQQLVKSFVIKDKQQRSAKVSNINVGRMSSSNIKKSPILSTTATSADGVLLKSAKTASGTMKQTKPVTQRPSAILLPETTSAAAATTTTTTTTAKTTAPTAVKLNDEKTATREAVAAIAAAAAATAAARRNGCASGKRHQETTATAIAKTKTASKLNSSSSSSNKFARDILDPQSLNLDLGLGLDLNDLTKLQTENLLKIKELLQQESVAAAADASAGDKPKKAATKTATTSKTVTTFTANNKKRSENMVATPAAASAAATTALRNTATSSTRDDNVKSPVTSNADGDEAVVVVVVADKNSNCTKKSNTSAATATATPTIIAANKSLLSEQLIASASSSSNVSENKNKIKSEEKSVKNKVIKASSISSRINSSSNSSSNNRNNSSSSNNKILREKSVASVKNTSKGSAIPTAITATPTATTTSNAATTPASATSKSLTAAAENITEAARTSMPAPAKVKLSRPLTNGQDKNLGRPILTRGSVAERVLMFEKCPDVRNSFLNIKRPDPADAPPRSVLKIKLHSTPPPPPEQNSLQKEIRTSGKSVYIPRFYFPHGKPQPQIAIERTLRGILSAFDSFPNNQVTKDELPRILKLCGLPFYWRMPVMIFCQHGQSGLVERQRFVEFWKQMNVYCHDNASRFVYILSRGQRFRSYILPEDLAPLVQDVVDTHPGLAFLKEATEFHSRYVHTVIARIFYAVNRSWSGKISIAELKKSDLLEIITLLEEEDDINQIMAFFSYEHFYVIYCKFWELDRDHDLLINQEDLSRYSDHALSTRITERIFSGCVTRVDTKKDPDEEPKMSYTDFVWFLLSEEDKRTPTAIEYWFRCMDVDGDGVLSMYELEYFYEEQQQRMESIGLETLPFEDCLCQMLDMIKPQNRDRITLGDLKRCKMTHVFFDTFFNLEKYLDHEQRDPFASQRDEYTSDWDRFAAQEYELLITEEND